LAKEAFAQKVFCVNGTVAWNYKVDFEPDSLYLDSEAAHI
jgi:hypothetical protein